MKLLAIVITFYPDLNDSIKNILRYIKYVDLLIIWENTPKADREKYRILLSEYSDKILYKGTGKNEGIAYPLNQVVKYGLNNGYTHLLTMDQDSYFINFKDYKSTIEKYIDQYQFGIFSPNINNIIKSENEIEKIPEAITSGSIYKLDIFKQELFFREDFFIDMVDNEFCYHAYTMNILTVILPKSNLKQKFGNMTQHGRLATQNYSAFRIYHIIRNYIVTWKMYPKLIQNKQVFIQKAIFNRIIKIILFESHKKQKLFAVYWGIRDGILNKMFERKF